jgi:hypothetical protein
VSHAEKLTLVFRLRKLTFVVLNKLLWQKQQQQQNHRDMPQKLKIAVPSSMAKIGYEDPLSRLVNAIALCFARWPGPRASKCRRR